MKNYFYFKCGKNKALGIRKFIAGLYYFIKDIPAGLMYTIY